MAEREQSERAMDDDLDEMFDQEVAGTDVRSQPSPVVAKRRAAPRTRAQVGGERLGAFVGRRLHFIREVVAELQKVIWPTRKELVTYATVVVVFVSIIMGFVALLDVAFARAMFLIFGGGGGSQ